MKKFQTLMEEIITEASLSRIYRKAMEHDSGSISAFRGDYTRAENRKRNAEIFKYLKGKDYSITKVKGSYIENFGEDNAQEVGEESLRVVDHNDTGNLKEDLIKMGKKFNQDSILWVPKGELIGYLIGTNKTAEFPGYGKTVEVGKAKFGKAVGEFFSRVKGRQFAFE